MTRFSFSEQSYDLWHDRAVFHFLTEEKQRSRYLSRLTHALRAGGQIVMATFGPDGPERCSVLAVQKYDAGSLQRAMGPEFCLVKDALVEHDTPFGTTQQFLYCHFQFRPAEIS